MPKEASLWFLVCGIALNFCGCSDHRTRSPSEVGDGDADIESDGDRDEIEDGDLRDAQLPPSRPDMSPFFLPSAVVTAFDQFEEPLNTRIQNGREAICESSTGTDGDLFVQDIDGRVWSGFFLFRPILVPADHLFAPGDLVEVDGIYTNGCHGADDFHNELGCDEADRAQEARIIDATVTLIGAIDPPEPTVVSVEAFRSPESLDPYLNMLIEVVGETALDPCPNADRRDHCDCFVDGGYDRTGWLQTEEFVLSNSLYSLPEGTVCVSNVTGVLTWVFDYLLHPRRSEDVVIPESCRR